VALGRECCQRTSKMKTPPASEESGGVFHAFTFRKVAALEGPTTGVRFRSARIAYF
jgi:hypothetical protein